MTPISPPPTREINTVYSKAAFSLVELLTTIAVLAAILTVAGFFIAGYVNYAHQQADQQTLAVLNDALGRYKTQGGSVGWLGQYTPPAQVISAMQNTVGWGGTNHQFLPNGVTYPGSSIDAKGTGAQYHFTRFNTYTAEPGGTSPADLGVSGGVAETCGATEMAIVKGQETPSNNSAVAAVQLDASNATPPTPVIVTPPQTDDLNPKNPVVVPQEKSIKPRAATPDMAAPVEALNTFSNYCVITLAAENDQIQKISNNGLRNKLSMSLLQIQTGVGNVISRQRALLEGIQPDTESMVFRTLSVTREAMTNALTRFSAEIYNATLRR